MAPPVTEVELVTTNSVRFVPVHVAVTPLIVAVQEVEVMLIVLGMSIKIHPVPLAYKALTVVKLTTS